MSQAGVAEVLARGHPDRVEMTTVGVDIGSSTSHLMFSRVGLQRLADRLSSRYVVVERTILWTSPILLTPFAEDGLIDAAELSTFVARAYQQAGIEAGGVDSGAVILTGVALRRANARSIAQKLAIDTGKFVCASAGHHLEAVLAAHGSGAVARSRGSGEAIHVDIGGGTTKLAIVSDGTVLATAALAVGGRLVAYDSERRLTRVEAGVEPLLRRMGVPFELGRFLSEDDERRLAGALAGALVDVVAGEPFTAASMGLLLTEAPTRRPRGVITVSGGVAEYMHPRGPPHYGDLGRCLAAAVVEQSDRAGRRLEVLGQPIRATAVGVSQFSVQVSGSTIGADEEVLPVRSVPLVHVGMPDDDALDKDSLAAAIALVVRHRQQGLDGSRLPGLHIRWSGTPSHYRLLATAQAVHRVWQDADRPSPLVVVFDRDVAASFARVMRTLDPPPPAMVVLDGLELEELDYLDIGRLVRPAGVVPVVVKSLLFADGA
ncbi:MAG: ethanolamine ammonia-lyase reactivating factor EutA [Acidimicrobiales bacterium]